MRRLQCHVPKFHRLCVYHARISRTTSIPALSRFYTTQHAVKDNIYASQRDLVIRDPNSYEAHLQVLFDKWVSGEPLHSAAYERDLDVDIPDELNHAFLDEKVNEFDVKFELMQHVKKLYDMKRYSLLSAILERITTNQMVMLRVKESFAEALSESFTQDVAHLEDKDHQDILFWTCMLYAHMGDAERAMAVFEEFLWNVKGNFTLNKSHIRDFVKLLEHHLPKEKRESAVEKFVKKYELGDPESWE